MTPKTDNRLMELAGSVSLYAIAQPTAPPFPDGPMLYTLQVFDHVADYRKTCRTLLEHNLPFQPLYITTQRKA